MFQKRLSPRIHWFDGMFLQPHHLQQFSRGLDEALTHRTRLLSPQQWGVYRMEIDQEALTGGRFALDQLEVVLPDGLVIQSEHLAVRLERDLAPFEERLRDGETLAIHLAVPSGGPKTVEAEGGEDVGYPVRYRAQPAVEVVDETTGGNAAPITFLRVSARLLAGEEDRSGCEVLPLAEVVYANDAFRLTDFIPPTILVTEESAIGDIVRKLCMAIRARATENAGTFDAAVRQHETGKTLETRFQSYGLVASLLPLEQMVGLECFRPVDIYMALCRVMGELSTLRPDDVLPPSAPKYEHLDLRGTFGALDERIRELLRPLETNYEQLEVRGADGTFEIVSIGAEHIGRPMYFSVRGGPRADPAALNRWVETNCVIAPRELVRELVDQRILGIERQLQEPAPLDYPHRRGDLVYRLMPSEEYIRALGRNPNLFIVRAQKSVPDTTAPRTLDFYVRKGR